MGSEAVQAEPAAVMLEQYGWKFLRPRRSRLRLFCSLDPIEVIRAFALASRTRTFVHVFIVSNSVY